VTGHFRGRVLRGRSNEVDILNCAVAVAGRLVSRGSGESRNHRCHDCLKAGDAASAVPGPRTACARPLLRMAPLIMGISGPAVRTG
jgi:hypothetical protein